MKTKCIAFAAALFASASAAQAEMKPFAQSGAWTALAGRNDAGTPMCSMSVRGNDRLAMVKWQVGGGPVFVQVYKGSWNIPKGIQLPLSIQFDKATPFAGIATSVTDKMIEARIKNDEDDNGDATVSFMQLFIAADKMVIQFPGGNESNWVANMDGSKTIGRRFVQCITEYNARYGSGATQPHQGGNATQPYGNSRETTQPYGKSKTVKPKDDSI